MKLGEIILPALILAGVAALLAVGYFYYAYSWTAFAFPLGAGLVLCLLCAVEVTGLLRARAMTVPPVDGQSPPLSISSIAWMFALSVFLYALGFVFGPAAYLLICLRANGFSWKLSAGSAVVMPVMIWALFIKAMGIQLPIWPLWMG